MVSKNSETQLKHKLNYQNIELECIILRKNVKNINLSIRSDMTIRVSANKRVPLIQITEFINKKSDWIIKHIKRYQARQPQEQSKIAYQSGETLRYLGNQYKLRVIQLGETSEVLLNVDISGNSKEVVKLYEGEIFLIVKDKNNYERKRKLINAWYDEKAREQFAESLEQIYPLVAMYGIAKPSIQMRSMVSRWGSCKIRKQTIQLNSKLIKTPRQCIDYVVLHELAHFIHRNHDKVFYGFITNIMPDWKQRSAMLDEEIVR